jgi:hypothetical protein
MTKLSSLLQDRTFRIGVAVGVSFLAGATWGVAMAKTALEQKYVDISDKEIAEAKKFYSVLNKTGDFATPEQAVETLEQQDAAEEAIRRYQGEEDEVDAIEKLLEDQDTHAEPESDDDWDYEIELANRTEEAPYIIHLDEFMGHESEYDQCTFTYFEGDDVLADERDGHIDHPERVIGPDNLKFGHGSNDKNLVYIRNDNLGLEFEVVLSKGKYVEEVLGFIEHRDHRKTPKFRGDDE